MKLLSLLLLILTFNCYSQSASNYKVQLESGSLITTDWLKLKNGSFSTKPYLRLDHKKGKRIKIENIISFQGYDSLKGNYFDFKKIKSPYNNKLYYTYRLFRSNNFNKTTLYYEELTYGKNKGYKKSRDQYFKKEGGSFKSLNYKNIRNDLSNSMNSNQLIKEVKQMRILQLISIGIGSYLIVNSIKNTSRIKRNDFNINSVKTLPFLAGNFFLIFPITLEKPIKNKLTKAVKVYN